MKKIVIAVLVLITFVTSHSQDLKTFKLYKPTENATEGIAKVVKEAKASNKNVFIQIGGNWCIWCARFHEFITSDKSIDSLVSANFVVYHLNFSDENHNTDILAGYGYPQRFGFPVFLVLDASGKLIHTQNSAYLELDKGYDKEKVMGFFNDWSPAALDPKRYDQ